MNANLNRKDFLKWVLYILLLPLLFLLNRMVKDHRKFGLSGRTKTIPNNIPQGLSIHDEVICYKQGVELNIYSSRCTHLGCRINTIEGDELVCPCHGSRYNTKGEPIKGPSVKNLESLEFSIDDSKGELTIKF